MILLFSLALISCAKKEDPNEYKAPLYESVFKVEKYKEFSSSVTFSPVSGAKTYNFNEENSQLTITFTNYSEASSTTCTGDVVYGLQIQTNEELSEAIDSDTDEIVDDTYTIFTPYLDDQENSNDSNTNDENQIFTEYAFIGTLSSNGLNFNCPISNPDTLYLYMVLLPSGTLTIDNYNRQVRETLSP